MRRISSPGHLPGGGCRNDKADESGREQRFPGRTGSRQGTAVDFADRDDYDKVLVERALLADREVAATILRLPAVYGPGDPHHRVAGPLRRLDAGEGRFEIGREQARCRWSRAYVENVAHAIVLAIESPAGAGPHRVLSIADEPALTEAEWIAAIAEAADGVAEIVAIDPDREAPAPYDGRYDLVLDSRRIRRELGFAEVVPLEEALRRTIAWERSAAP